MSVLAGDVMELFNHTLSNFSALKAGNLISIRLAAWSSQNQLPSKTNFLTDSGLFVTTDLLRHHTIGFKVAT